MLITNLKCEYGHNPVGLDIPDPQFSWQISSEKRGLLQTAYQLIVTEYPEPKSETGAVTWDTGKVKSGRSAGIGYAGPFLESRKRYYWQVRIWSSESNKSKWSEPAIFEMGLLKKEDWKASWIGFPAGRTGRVLYFRKNFSLTKTVQKARVYISGLGYYVLYLNGHKAGDHVLDPGTSDYNKRNLYSTYDITDVLRRNNVMSIIVGPGWYGNPKLILQAEFTYRDGNTDLMVTNWDPSHPWLVTTGPLIQSSIFDGEICDARKDNPEWLLPSGNKDHLSQADRWVNAVITDAPGGVMVSQIQEPVKVVETISPVSVSEPIPGIYVIDAGRNLAGWAAIKVRGSGGTQISLKFAETLNPDGTVNQQNLRSAKARDIYVLKGGGFMEEWEPSFTYHGFRYIQVEGFPYFPKKDSIRIRIVRSAVLPVGSFTCSNDLLNRIHQMVRNTEANNLHSIPTDCPQRDERMGWLNDMTVRMETALYNFDLARFYIKWIDDIKDTQSDDGAITDTAPFRWGFRPADPVSASYLLLALKSYEFYGNLRIIQKHYDGLKAWVNYIYSRTENGIVDYSYWGDWSPPEKFGTPGSIGSGAVSKNTPGKLISTGYLYYCSSIITYLASVLDKKEDEKFYRSMSEEIAAAFNSTYYDEKKGGYGSNNQACNSFALFLGISGKERTTRVVKNLAADVKKNHYHLTTGNLCTKYLLETLTEYGYPELAFKIAIRETYPGWGFMLAHGATALWERWENKTGGEMNSHNHPMMGSVGSWFYKYLLGIVPDSKGPGFEKFMIKPFIPALMDFAEGVFHSIKGTIKVNWRKKSGSLFLDLIIPGNTSANVYIPTKNMDFITEGNRPVNTKSEIIFLRMEKNYAVFELLSGTYHFKSDW